MRAERNQGAESQPKSSNQGGLGTGDEDEETREDHPGPLPPIGTEDRGTDRRAEPQEDREMHPREGEQVGKTGMPGKLLEGEGVAVALTEEKHEGKRSGPFIGNRPLQPAAQPLQDGAPPTGEEGEIRHPEVFDDEEGGFLMERADHPDRRGGEEDLMTGTKSAAYPGGGSARARFVFAPPHPDPKQPAAIVGRQRIFQKDAFKDGDPLPFDSGGESGMMDRPSEEQVEQKDDERTGAQSVSSPRAPSEKQAQ